MWVQFIFSIFFSQIHNISLQLNFLICVLCVLFKNLILNLKKVIVIITSIDDDVDVDVYHPISCLFGPLIQLLVTLIGLFHQI